MARDPDEDYDDEDDLSEDEDDEEGPEVGVTVEIVGLSLYTHHGVTAAEREIGQRLVLDVRFDVGEPDALITDRVEDTVDYGEVCQEIALVAQQRSYKTLERLCAAIAERLDRRVGVEPRRQRSSRHTSTATSSTGSGIGGSGFVALTVTLSAPNCEARRSAITAHRRSRVR